MIDPLVDVDPDKLRVDATFPWSAWRPDFFSYAALAEFARTDWRCIDSFDPPKAFDDPDMFQELEELIAMARDERAERTQEILDQDPDPGIYFAHMLMLTPTSHPNTLRILAMADRVGLMVAVHFKLTFNRARPQQVFPALLPLVNAPRHASFPSGHALESHLIALALAEVMPWAREALVALADRIGRNREVAGVHWKSDTDAGRAIAQAAFPLLRDCPIFQTVLQAAAGEPAVSDELAPPEECA